MQRIEQSRNHTPNRSKTMYQQKDTTAHLLYSQERSPEDNTPLDNSVPTGDDAG
jgi:hypothetical protein